MDQRSKYLKNFNQVFGYVDTDKDGVLSCEQFSDLVQKLALGLS